jgi:signal transduction histidine kinase
MMRMSNRETTAALRRLNEMLEAQARRIAHDLHDEFAQLLATVYLELAEINRQSTSDSIHTLVEQITSHLDMARDHLRRLSHELRPPALDQLGLLPALEFLVKGYGKRSGLSVTVTGSTEGRLKDEVETALYRIVQEALNNVTRHAKAGHVQVNLWRAKGMIRCTVRDDGVGFSVPTFNAGKASNGLGLMGIQERLRPLYGSMTIDSTPGDGTELSITIPIGG